MEEVKGYEIHLSLNADDVVKGLKDLSSQLSSEERQLKDINSKLKFDPKNLSYWNEKQSILNKCIEDTKKKLSLQNAQLSEASKLLKSGSISDEEFKKMESSVSRTETSLARLNAELKKTNAEQAKLSGSKWDVLIDVSEGLSKITKAAVATATAMASLVAVGIHSLTTWSDTAAEVGMTAEAYQRLSSAANAVGVSTQTLKSGLNKLSSTMISLFSGTGADYEKALEKIGLSYKDLEGLSVDEALKKISTALKGTSDATTRSSVVLALFGNELGTKLLPLLEQGGDAIDALGDKAVVASDEEVEAAKEVSTSVAEAKNALITVAGVVAKAILPQIKEVVAWVKEKMVPALKSGVDWVSNLSAPAKKVIGVITGLIVAAGPIIGIIGKVGKAVTEFKASIGGLLGSSSKGLLGLVAAHPLIAAAIAAITAIFVKGYTTDVEFRKSVDDIIASLKELVSGVFKDIVSTFKQLKPYLDQIISALVDLVKKILPVLKNVIDQLMPVIKKIITIVSEATQKIIPILAPVITKIINLISDLVVALTPIVVKIVEIVTKLVESLMPIISEIIDVIGDVIGWISDVVGAIVDALGPALTDFLSLLSPILDLISDVLVPLIKGIIDFLSPIIDGVRQIIKTIGDEAFKVFATVLGKIGECLSTIFQWIKPVVDWFEKLFSDIGTGVSNFFSGSGFKSMLDWIINAFQTIVTWVQNAINKVKEFFGLDGGNNNVFTKIGGWFSDTWGNISGWFSDVGSSISNWASDTWNNVSGWFSDVGNNIGNWFGSVFGQQTPQNAVMPSVQRMARANSETSGGSQSTNNTYNITINTTADHMSIDEINDQLGYVY